MLQYVIKTYCKDMKLNYFQQAEVDSHKDAELSWIIQSAISSFTTDKTNFSADNKFRPFALYQIVGLEVSKTIADREGFNSSEYWLTKNEAGDCLSDEAREKNIEKKSYDDYIFPFLDKLIYKSLMRTRFPLTRSSSYDYVDFSQDGGFCNPYKIQMMNDD